MIGFEILRQVHRMLRGERRTESLIKKGLKVGVNFGREGGKIRLTLLILYTQVFAKV